MNKELKGRVFNIPQNVLDLINHTISGLGGSRTSGIQRAEKLLQDKKVNYGQLKRIIHDLQNMDKTKDVVKYNLAGGEVMLNWGTKFLTGERDLISNKKDSKKRADEITSITGERKNSHLTKHKKRFSFITKPNFVKNSSQKSSITPLTSLGLFEEINKIKKLIKY
jgi:hypothetical protein